MVPGVVEDQSKDGLRIKFHQDFLIIIIITITTATTAITTTTTAITTTTTATTTVTTTNTTTTGIIISTAQSLRGMGTEGEVDRGATTHVQQRQQQRLHLASREAVGWRNTCGILIILIIILIIIIIK